ncbi:MAG: hypothetical protein KC656_36695, partial [Myxococcales bacterium]|nr:hypothetical protein [Myxococcales bacterium]
MVTDNGVAISTTPDEGRGIKSFEAYAAGFGMKFFSCDGRDFWDTYDVTAEAAAYVRAEQKPVLLHVKHLPRFNGHSSAADMTFDLSQDDPLVAFGESLAQRAALDELDVLRRKPGQGRDFFAHHELGRVMAAEDEEVRALFDQVRAEPDPPTDSILENLHAPFPDVVEHPGEGTTNISYAGAIRAAIDHILSRHHGALWGQDVARLGGVMQATAGLLGRHPG